MMYPCCYSRFADEEAEAPKCHSLHGEELGVGVGQSNFTAQAASTFYSQSFSLVLPTGHVLPLPTLPGEETEAAQMKGFFKVKELVGVRQAQTLCGTYYWSPRSGLGGNTGRGQGAEVYS